jgi:hypothetical protein
MGVDWEMRIPCRLLGGKHCAHGKEGVMSELFVSVASFSSRSKKIN